MAVVRSDGFLNSVNASDVRVDYWKPATLPCVCLIVAAIFCLFGPGQSRAEEPNLLDKLIPLWKSQKTEIASAHLKYKLFQQSANDFAPLTGKQVEDLISSVDLAKNPDDLQRIIRALWPTRKPVEPSWVQMESYFEGSKAREADLANKRSYQVFDGKETIYYDGFNKQANLLGESGPTRYLPMLTEFRGVPDPNYRGYRVTNHVGEAIEISESDERFTTSFEIEAATGMIKREITQTKNGLVLAERFQNGFVTYPSGIVFPTVSVRAKFAVGALSWIRITVIEEAQFNVPLPANAFAAEAPQGVNVFDQREQGSIKTFKTAAPIPNLAVAADERLQPNPATPDSGTPYSLSRLRLIAVAILLLLLTVGGWLLWRRRTKWLGSR